MVTRRTILRMSLAGPPLVLFGIPSSNAVALPILGWFGKFALSVGSTVVAKQFNDYLDQNLNFSHLVEIFRVNRVMAENGGFTDTSNSEVHEAHKKIFYPARQPEGLNICVPFFDKPSSSSDKSSGLFSSQSSSSDKPLRFTFTRPSSTDKPPKLTFTPSSSSDEPPGLFNKPTGNPKGGAITMVEGPSVFGLGMSAEMMSEEYERRNNVSSEWVGENGSSSKFFNQLKARRATAEGLLPAHQIRRSSGSFETGYETPDEYETERGFVKIDYRNTFHKGNKGTGVVTLVAMNTSRNPFFNQEFELDYIT